MMDPRLSHLRTLAASAAATWMNLGERIFGGELFFETESSVYAFHDGVFVSRARKPARFFESPASLQGARLVGFFDGTGKLSTDYERGHHAVIWQPKAEVEQGFVLTSRVIACSVLAHGLAVPNGTPIRTARPKRPHLQPSFRPSPASMTRIHSGSDSLRSR